MAKKPLLLLDIDGVIAPFNGSDSHYRHELGFHPIFGDELDIWLHNDLQEMVARLLPVFKLMWATGWNDPTQMLIPMGLEDPLDRIDYDIDVPGIKRIVHEPGWVVSNDESWKMPWIRHLLDNSDLPAVWIDDEVLQDGQDYAAKRTLAGTPTLFIRTDPNIGFLHDHVGDLIRWAKEISEAS